MKKTKPQLIQPVEAQSRGEKKEWLWGGGGNAGGGLGEVEESGVESTQHAAPSTQHYPNQGKTARGHPGNCSQALRTQNRAVGETPLHSSHHKHGWISAKRFLENSRLFSSGSVRVKTLRSTREAVSERELQ